MLNFPTPNEFDIELLQGSYDAIQQKDQVEIISNEDEIKQIKEKIVITWSLPTNCSLIIANLFKVKPDSGVFYIAQILLDYGYSYRGNDLRDKYEYHVVGLATLKKDIGSIMARPEGRADKFLDRFLKSDIKFPDADKFNAKYYVVSEHKDCAFELLGSTTREALLRSEELQLKVNKKDIFIAFENSMREEQSQQLEKILSSMSALLE